MRSVCAEIQEQAAGLVSLAADDPDRRAAFTHAVTCGECAAALAEGGAVLALLDRALQAEAPRPEVLARVKRALRDEIPAARDRPPAGDACAPGISVRPGVVASVAGALLFEWALLIVKRWTSSDARALFVSALLALPGTAIAVAAFRARRGAAALLAVPALSLGAALASEGSAGPQIAMGIECAIEVTGAALLPFVLLLLVARRGLVPRLETVGPAVAAAGALNAQAALRLACPAQPGVLHALLFHSLPVVLVAGVCFLIAARLAARPWARPRAA